ncbi:MAG: efflux RND transporter permease subunit, partial [Lentisphaeria bacterium]|nr:efflux RND transporter permease subunit [Lentisphaeria bacterium]
KYAVILIDEITLRLKNATHTDQKSALLEASVIRIRPVLLAALTTILGMAPLVTDAFFSAMAVTIMAGLAFACILTLIVVPVFYSLFYKIQ